MADEVMITVAEAAAALNGSEYREEGSAELWKRLKVAGIVAVFGASDDLMEFEGAIRDELGVYDHGVARLTATGLFQPCECNCDFSRQAEKATATIDAYFDRDGFSWIYETTIPHETFTVMEDGETYCRGIVFSLSDLRALSTGGTHAS